MIKYFRKIRQELLNKGKTTKYLKYAIGEIVLVVIGILIALAINSKYNDAQNEKKTQTILKQVQKELLTDIKEAKRIFGKKLQSVSYVQNILNNKLTVEYFKKNPLTVFFSYRMVSFSNKKTGYERFKQNLENLPEKYNILLPYFNQLFREYQNELDDYNEAIKDYANNERYDDFETNPNSYLWYTDRVYDDDEAKTILNDPYLKNKIIGHAFYLNRISRSANDYRILSIEFYKKIDMLLGTQPTSYPDILSTIPKEKVLKDILGKDTKMGSENPAEITITLSDKKEYLEINHSEFGEMKVFWNGDDYYFMEKYEATFKPYKNEKGQQVWEATNELLKTIYIKTSDLNL